MILLFLGDWRSSLIVVLTIPFSILTAIVLLWASGQTINIMTLGGLALAIGVLVDEGTVVLENIHTHLEHGAPRARAILDASREVVVPRLLAMLAIFAVFVPSFFMTGVARASLQTLNEIQKEAGDGNVSSSLEYVGMQGASYPINTVFLWTGGPQDAIFQIAVNPDAKIDIAKFEEKLRQRLPQQFPGCQFSFQAGDLVSQIMNFGSPTPVEIAVSGTDFDQVRSYAAKLRASSIMFPPSRDVQYEEALDYPSFNVNINRELAGQLGLTAKQVGNSLLTATSSSRFVSPNYWADPRTGVGCQIQVQIP
jgi:multidrug efflux pump subunit AcrB